MASDELPQGELGFLTDVDIGRIFESEKVFADELETQTMARFNWMVTRHRATLLLLAHELGIDPETAAKLSTAHMFLAREFGDFVSVGIDADDAVSAPQHPLDEVINDLVSDATEPSFIEALETLGPVCARMAEILYSSDEELIHRLERLPKSE